VKNPLTNLFIGDLKSNKVTDFVKLDKEDGGSTRADWCWKRSKVRPPEVGPVAFSNTKGIWLATANGLREVTPKLLQDTEGMAYPSWYPECHSIAVDVASENSQVIGSRFTAKIDVRGKVVTYPLADHSVWAGFPSVNQANPKLVSFAGQTNGEKSGFANYYNQDLNYIWVTDRSNPNHPKVKPLEQQAKPNFGFVSKFQARAGWWSPDGKWFAFESNRNCNNANGLVYAIFIVDSSGKSPPMQVSDCKKWNVQHPKWYPAGANGVSTRLIAAVAVANQNGTGPFHVATFDVTAFVQ
jgi:hypothetical protein